MSNNKEGGTVPASTKKSGVAAALAAAVADIKRLGKEAKNDYHKYQYTSGEQRIQEARRVASMHGLTFRIKSWDMEMLTDQYYKLICFGEILHESGESIESERIVLPFRDAKGKELDKAMLAALTEAYGYWLRCTLMIDSGKDEGVSGRDDTGYSSKSRPAAAHVTAMIEEANKMGIQIAQLSAGARKYSGKSLAQLSVDDCKNIMSRIKASREQG